MEACRLDPSNQQWVDANNARSKTGLMPSEVRAEREFWPRSIVLMIKRILIDGTHKEELRVVIMNGNRLDEYDVETSTKTQLKANIYLAKVMRVEPSLQAAFVDYGGNRHGFLAFNEIHPDYYQIPVEDREELKRDVAQYGVNASAAQAHVDAIDGEIETLEPAPVDGNWVNSDETEYKEQPKISNSDSTLEPVEKINPVESPIKADKNLASEEVLSKDNNDKERENSNRLDNGLHDRSEHPLRRYTIQEVIKRRQILLIQVVKEERGNKGAAVTTYISLAGRYCVLMPNTSRNVGGVSRKITSSVDRKRLRDLMQNLDVPEGMGLIMRTAGMERNKMEIKRDFDYLTRLWNEVRDLTFKSAAPCLVYEEGNLIKRTIRDLYTREIEEVLVEGDDAYKAAKKLMRLMMPSHAKRVQPYKDLNIPLFHRYQVENHLESMLSPTVQLKSGGYIVINPTEALVAIDVNSGRATRERNIEETAVKTNLEAASEISRQLRLRDLAGLIVIDFIDMEEKRNQRLVQKRFRETVKPDRARIQLGSISGFGLFELSRQRMRPSILESSTEPCSVCDGSGYMRSTESMAVRALRLVEEEGTRKRSIEISVKVPTEIALYILNQKRESLVEIEKRYEFNVRIDGDSTLKSQEMKIERINSKNAEQGKSQTINETTQIENKFTLIEKNEKTEKGNVRKRRPRRKRKKETSLQKTEGKATDEKLTENKPTIEKKPKEDGVKKPSEDVHRRRRGRRSGYRGTQKTNVTANKGKNHKIQKEMQIDATKPDSLDDKHPVSTSGAKSMPSNKNNIPEVQHDTDLSSQKNLNDVESGNSSGTSVPKKGWWQRIIE